MNIVSITLQMLLILMFLMASFGKLRGAKTIIEEFEKLRLPQWFRVITGIIEFVPVAASSSLLGMEMQGAMAIFSVNLKRILKLMK